MASLAEIRALLKAESERAEAQKNGTFKGERQPDAFLAFWNIPDNESLNLRFLNDADPSNPYFWKERDMIKLTFRGVVGGTNDFVSVQVPCNEMWVPKGCPILNELRQWYKIAEETGNEDLKKQAGQYWKKRSYLLQCFIAPDSVAVKDDVSPENPIRRVLLNKELFTKVKSILMNTGVKELPTHPVHGRDFSVVKAKNGGGFNSYDSSQFSMSERELNDVEQAAIEQYGLFDLSEFMPKQPSTEELQAIKEMFEASVDGQPYDPARWAQFYRPAGVAKPNTTTSVPQTATAPVQTSTQETTTVKETVVQTESVQEATAQPASTSQSVSASDLVARLKARNN